MPPRAVADSHYKERASQNVILMVTIFRISWTASSKLHSLSNNAHRMYWKKSLCCYCDTDTEAWYSSSRSSIVISADGPALQKSVCVL